MEFPHPANTPRPWLHVTEIELEFFWHEARCSIELYLTLARLLLRDMSLDNACPVDEVIGEVRRRVGRK